MIRLRTALWSDQVAADLGTIRDAGPDDLAWWRAGVEAGRLQCLAVEVSGFVVGHLVWTVETETDGRRAAVIHAIGARPMRGVDLVGAILDRFRVIGRATGLGLVRCWTTREGLRRRIEALGGTTRYVLEVRP